MDVPSNLKSASNPSVEFAGGLQVDTPNTNRSILSHDCPGVLEEYEIFAPNGVSFFVYRQPSISKSSILTYHDIGTNHTSFFGFFSCPEMRVISRHFTIYHVCAPGHHESAETITTSQRRGEGFSFLSSILNWHAGSGETQASFPRSNEGTSRPIAGDNGLFGRRFAYQNVADLSNASYANISRYPSMDELAELLTAVVDRFKINFFIGMGMGAGSNVLARFALHHPDNVIALFLLNPNGGRHGYYEWFRARWSDLPNLQRGYLTENLLSQLEAHWFGYGLANNIDLVAFYNQLLRKLNPVNLAGYIESYINRTDLGLVRCLDPPAVIEQRERESLSLGSAPTAIKVSCCLVTGSLAQDLAHSLADLNGRMDPRKTQFLVVPDCNGFLMEENADKLAIDFLHFLRNEGFLVSMTPERLHNEAVALQAESTQRTNQVPPGFAFVSEKEAFTTYA